MDDKNNNNDLDIEIVMGDDSELEISEIKDSIKTLRPTDKVKKENIIIPKSRSEREEKKIIKP